MALAGRDKAMMLLSFLGGDVSQQILRHLSPENAEQIVGEVNNLPHPSPESLQEILGEVSEALSAGEGGLGRSSVDYSAPSPAPGGPMMDLAERLSGERPPLLAFVAAELTEPDREQFLDHLGERRRDVEQLIKQQRKSPITQSIAQQIIHGAH